MWVQRGEGLSQGGPGETEPGKDMAGSVMATGRPESKGLKGKLQAQVYNILPPTLAITGYARRLPNTHINELSVVLKWHYVCNRRLNFTGVSFAAAHIAYTSARKTKIVSIGIELILYTGRRASCLALRRYVDSTVLLVPYKPFEGC